MNDCAYPKTLGVGTTAFRRTVDERSLSEHQKLQNSIWSNETSASLASKATITHRHHRQHLLPLDPSMSKAHSLRVIFAGTVQQVGSS